MQRVADIADCIRVDTNAQNFQPPKEIGLTNKPVMLKRGLAMTIDEWLQAAEYIVQRGDSDVILCERGIRTFSPPRGTPSTSPAWRSPSTSPICR